MIRGQTADVGPNIARPHCAFWLSVVHNLSSGGAIAQLGERLNGIQEVGGSTPPGSTKNNLFHL
jgi:hypothetical protein